MEWLLAGKEPQSKEPSDPCQPCPLDGCGDDIKERCQKVVDVMKSGTGYADALGMNIDWFSQAVDDHRKSKRDQAEMKAEFAALNKKLDEILAMQQNHVASKKIY